MDRGPCTVVITPQIEILKRYINEWKRWRNVMFVLLVITLSCVCIFIRDNKEVIEILFFALLPVLIGAIIGGIIGSIIGAIIVTIRNNNNKGKIYQIYYQSKDSQWVALPFFYNYEYFQAKKGFLSELQATYPELNVVMKEAQAPSIHNIQNPVLDSRHQFFHDFIRIFHVSIKCVTELDEQVPSYTQKEIESLILNYAKKYNISTVVLDNIDPTYVTYYNELNSVMGWFRLLFWIVITLFIFLLLSFILLQQLVRRVRRQVQNNIPRAW
jgi:hypothetical protein